MKKRLKKKREKAIKLYNADSASYFTAQIKLDQINMQRVLDVDVDIRANETWKKAINVLANELRVDLKRNRKKKHCKIIKQIGVKFEKNILEL